MSLSPYDEPLRTLRENTGNLAAWLAVWQARKEPDAFARRCAADAVDAIDAMLGELYRIRGHLTAETRQADDATAARVDALLRRDGERS